MKTYKYINMFVDLIGLFAYGLRMSTKNKKWKYSD